MERYVFGVDVGGTTAKLGLFDVSGESHRAWEIPTGRTEDGAGILPAVARSILGVMGEQGIPREEIWGIGLGVPGAVVDGDLVPLAVNIGWRNRRVTTELSELTGLSVAAENDANVAALGEAWLGGGRGFRNVLFVTLGTGVGGGVIADGRLVSGARGAAGEIGHIHVEDRETERCSCGHTGCLEQYASATGAVRLAKRRLAQADAGSILAGRAFTCKDLFEAAAAGDAVAQEVCRLYGDYLGKGLAICASVLNPEAIVLGGGVSNAGERLTELVRPAFDRFVFASCAGVDWRLASLGDQAGVVGAAKLMLDRAASVDARSRI